MGSRSNLVRPLLIGRPTRLASAGGSGARRGTNSCGGTAWELAGLGQDWRSGGQFDPCLGLRWPTQQASGLLEAACAAKGRVSAAEPAGVRACALCWARVRVLEGLRACVEKKTNSGRVRAWLCCFAEGSPQRVYGAAAAEHRRGVSRLGRFL